MIWLSLLDENVSIREPLSRILRAHAYAAVFQALKKSPCLSETVRSIWHIGHQAFLLDSTDDEKLAQLLSELANEKTKAATTKYIENELVNGQEHMMCYVETQFYPILAKLVSGVNSEDLSIQEISAFLLYAIVQLIRSPGRFTHWNHQFEERKGLRVFMMSHWILKTFVMLSDVMNRFQISTIENRTTLPFVTGDVPLLNLMTEGARAKHFDLFFPLSPTRAVFYAEIGRRSHCYPEFDHLTVSDVHRLNCQLANNCEHLIFGSNYDVLKFGGYKTLNTHSKNNLRQRDLSIRKHSVSV